jgi:hypothetical protein
MAMSAPFVWRSHHLLGRVSLEKANLRPFHSRMKLTDWSAWIAGMVRTLTPFSL